MKRDDSAYLKHIWDAICTIEEYTRARGYEDFMDNHLVQDGVIRQIEIIGEATKGYPRKSGQNMLKYPGKI